MTFQEILDEMKQPIRGDLLPGQPAGYNRGAKVAWGLMRMLERLAEMEANEEVEL